MKLLLILFVVLTVLSTLCTASVTQRECPGDMPRLPNGSCVPTGRGGDAHFDDDDLWLLQPSDDDEKGPKKTTKWAITPHYRPEVLPPSTTTTTTTTTTNLPVLHHHHNRHPKPYPNRGHTPVKYPSYYPFDRPSYHPDRPHYRDHRHHNVSEDHPRSTNHHHTYHPTETTTHPITYRPRYPDVQPEYPSNSRSHYPNDDPEKTTQRTTTTTPSDKPDTCDTSYDAVAVLLGELFIFKNRYFWRIGIIGLYDDQPTEIIRMWASLPKNLTHVDAVYERPDRKIAIFLGKELYLFNAINLVPGYPKPLSTFGLPESLDKLDAAMVWGHNGNTYFYSGTMYWKYDEENGRVDLDYPRNMAVWKGVGYHIDSVFQWADGKTYFFKGKGFWKFNDLKMRVENEKQFPSSKFWMRCATTDVAQ